MDISPPSAPVSYTHLAYDVKDISVSISLERDDFQNSVVGMSKNSLESIIKAVISDQSFAGFINHLQASSADTVYAEETLEYGVGGINPQGKYPLRYVLSLIHI